LLLLLLLLELLLELRRDGGHRRSPCLEVLLGLALRRKPGILLLERRLLLRLLSKARRLSLHRKAGILLLKRLLLLLLAEARRLRRERTGLLARRLLASAHAGVETILLLLAAAGALAIASSEEGARVGVHGRRESPPGELRRQLCACRVAPTCLGRREPELLLLLQSSTRPSCGALGCGSELIHAVKENCKSCN